MSKQRKEREVPTVNRRTTPKNDTLKKGVIGRLKGYFARLVDNEMRPQVLIGLLCLALALFFVYTFVDYIVHGANYQSLILSNNEEAGKQFVEEVKGRSGIIGTRWMHYLVNEWVGLSFAFIIYMIGAIGLSLLSVRRISYFKTIVFCSIATFWTSLFLTWAFRPIVEYFFFYPGGIVGETLYLWLKEHIGEVGVIILIFLLLLTILFFSFSSIRQIYIKWVRRQKEPTIIAEKPEKEYVIEEQLLPSPVQTEEPNPEKTEIETITLQPVEEEVDEAEEDMDIAVVDRRFDAEEGADDKARTLVEQLGPLDPKAELSRYQMPPLDLLKQYSVESSEIDHTEIQENKDMIVNTLRSFKIEIKSIIATVGPAITLYEVVPEDGIHISKIKNLEDNISMSLSSNGIRIIAPMPGKGTIGLEVPNKKPQMVSMRSVIASKKFQESKAELPIALGRTITNDVFVFDLAKAPHLLVAGATGQGKSVGLNAIISSLLYKKHPAELKFVMIDPKMVEFSMYSLIEKHYMAKLPEETQTIITDTKRSTNTLNSLCQEMDDRYDLLSKAHVRNIKEYNEKFANRLLSPEKGHRYMPYIVLIIDEYGDLIMTAGKEIEMPITRLAQKARAVGIHAIIATQRPTASIITGAIKANFPGRLAFRVITAVDSRIILDATGANRLVGRGDSLYSQGNDLTRIQCAFIDTPEVNNVVRYIQGQPGFPTAYDLPEVRVESSDSSNSDFSGALDPNDRDPLFNEVAERLVMEQRASTSFIQQIFAIGYNRAARITVQLEAAGIIGPQDGSKQREVLVQSQEQLQRILNPNEY